MAADLVPCATSQSASAPRSTVVVPKLRIAGLPSSPRAGPQTQCCELPMSMPATVACTVGSDVAAVAVVVFVLVFVRLAMYSSS